MDKLALLLLFLPVLANATVVRYEGAGTMETKLAGDISATVSMVIDYGTSTITELELDSELFSFSLATQSVLDIDIHEYDSGPYEWTLNIWDTVPVRMTNKVTSDVSESAVYFDWLFVYPTGMGYTDIFNAAGPLLGVNDIAGHFYFYPNAPGTILDATPVPEPSTLALFGLGLAAFGWKRRKS